MTSTPLPEHICHGGTWNNGTKQFECEHTDTLPEQGGSYQKREAEYKRDWIYQHDKADTLLADEKTKQPVAAIYYYQPMQHVADQKKIWRMIGARMELKRLEEMENE